MDQRLTAIEKRPWHQDRFSSLFSFFHLIFLIILQGLECFRRQRDQCYHIEHCHQSHAQISQIPDKLICGKSSDKKHNESQHFIQRLRCPVIPKEVCHIRSCVEQDT